MKLLKKYHPWIIEAVYLCIVFSIAQLPLRDFDIWFHMKAGELFVTKGHLVFNEVFSYAAAGRAWTPFEWLFQIIIYYVSTLGLSAIPPFIAFFVAATHFFLLRIFRYIFHVSLLPSILLSLAFLVSTYEFNTARPHTISYLCLTILLFLILARVFKKKKWIYASPLLVLFWTNIHSSGFLAWGFMLSFTISLAIQWFFTKKDDTLKIVKEFSVLTIIDAVVTILPPLGLLDYQLLWRFFTERKFLAIFISEWSSPTDNPFGFKVYTATVIGSFVLFIFIVWKNKLYKRFLWALPLLASAIFGYSATRNVYIGTLGIILLLGWSFGRSHFFEDKKYVRYGGFLILTAAFLGFYGWVYALKHYNLYNDRLYYPVDSTEFVKRYMNGNMFNDYNYGGYMLYYLYPYKKVFIDGRADVYLCCEMHDYLDLSVYKNLPDNRYRQFLDAFWYKYHINYAVIGTQKNNVFRKIARLLNDDPNWSLVFWDDSSQVFARKDGVNDDIIKKLGTHFATPYLRDPYRKGHREEALEEYMRADRIAKSARTSNAIGYILGQKGQLQEALKMFQEAQSIDPSFESPYMNLAELAAHDNDLPGAIDLYRRALNLAPDRGLIYIRLGELTLQATGDMEETRRIWQQGIDNTIDSDAKQTLRQLLSKLH